MKPVVPPMNAYMPTMGNAFVRGLGRCLLRLFGWRVIGNYPQHTHLVVAAAPHTSNWDFIISMVGVMATGIKWSFLMKKEAFFFPFTGLFKKLGGIPIDRSDTSGLIDQAVEAFNTQDKLWLAIAPEGTRSKTDHYKTGFLRIAEQAQVPVFIISWNYPSKEIVISEAWTCTGDAIADADNIRRYVNDNFVARHPEKQ